MKGELPKGCPKHPHTPLPKGKGNNNKCPNCEGERLAARDRKSPAKPTWAPFHEAVRGSKGNHREKAEREGRVEARHTGRYQ